MVRPVLGQGGQRHGDQLGDGLATQSNTSHCIVRGSTDPGTQLGVLVLAAEGVAAQRLHDAGDGLRQQQLVHTSLDTGQALVTGEVPVQCITWLIYIQFSSANLRLSLSLAGELGQVSSFPHIHSAVGS